MIHPNIKFWRSIGTMIGAIVGVGVFGLPYAFAQSGFLPGLVMLLLMAVLLTTMQLMFAEVVVQTGGNHRLVGYIREYFGKGWGRFSVTVLSVSMWGAMVAYMIVGGRFLHVLVSPVLGGTETFYAIFVGVVAGLLVYRGIVFAAKLEATIVIVLLFLFTFITIVSLPEITFSNLSFINSENLLFPYGVILFAFAGIGIVPEMRYILGKKQETNLPFAIILGMLIILAIYAAFTFSVVGVTGASTTQAAFDGLVPVFGQSFLVIGAVLGTITILSIYMILGVQLMNIFRYDFEVKKRQAWGLVAIVPIALYLIGFQEFIQLIGFVGGVLVGIIGILIVLTYERMRKSPICKKHKCLDLPHILSWLIAFVFLAGIVMQITMLLS